MDRDLQPLGVGLGRGGPFLARGVGDQEGMASRRDAVKSLFPGDGFGKARKRHGVEARLGGQLLAQAVGLAFLFPAIGREGKGCRKLADSRNNLAQAGGYDGGSGSTKGSGDSQRSQGCAGGLKADRVAGGDMADFMAKDGRQLVLGIHESKQPAGNVNMTTRKREGVGLRHVGYVEAIVDLSPGRVLGESLTELGDVSFEGRILDEADFAFDAVGGPIPLFDLGPLAGEDSLRSP